MHEIFQQILRYLREMWLRRWIGLAVAWIVAAVGVAVVYGIPEKYEASARVYVDTQSLLRPLLAGLAIQPNVDQQVSLMSRTLVSRPNVEKLMRMADLDHGVRTQPERDALIESIIQAIKLSGNTASNLYMITYRDTSPEKARTVVQSLLTIFVESGLGDNRQDSRAAVRFIDDQIKRYEESLKVSENRLKEFKLRYIGVADRDVGYFARLSQLQTQIEAAKIELASIEQTRDSHKRELAGEQPIFLSEAPGPGASPSLEGAPQIDARLASLRNTLDELLRKYTDQHPDVVATTRRIAQLEEEKRTELAAQRKAAAAESRPAQNAPERNPVFQQLRMSLAEAEGQVAAAKAKLAGLEAQHRQLRSQAQLVPQIEAEFTQLNRDYDVQKKTYESLLARRESAGLGADVQDRSGAQFRVIDPPRVSPQPVAPNRVALLALAFAAALGAGLVASLVASQLKTTIIDSRSLREVTGRPVLGMVSMIASPAVARSRRRRSVLFAGGLGTLFAAFGAILAFALLVARTA